MYVISRTYSNRKLRSIPLLLLSAVFLVMTFVFTAPGWLIPSGIFAVSGILLLKYANYIPILYHDPENRRLVAVARKKQIFIPVEGVLNVTPGISVPSYESILLSLVGFPGGSTASCYYLKTARNEVFGTNIKFKIYSEDKECQDNFARLRAEIISMRSSRAKEIVAGREKKYKSE